VIEGDEAMAFGLIGCLVGGEALAGGGVDNFDGGAGFGSAKPTGERAGVADGDEGIEGARGERRTFTGAGDGFGAHARTGSDGFRPADAGR